MWFDMVHAFAGLALALVVTFFALESGVIPDPSSPDARVKTLTPILLWAALWGVVFGGVAEAGVHNFGRAFDESWWGVILAAQFLIGLLLPPSNKLERVVRTAFMVFTLGLHFFADVILKMPPSWQ